jgi:hypothetical protein
MSHSSRVLVVCFSLLAAACSFRSLDYLDAVQESPGRFGQDSVDIGGTGGGGASAGASTAPSAGAAAPAPEPAGGTTSASGGAPASSGNGGGGGSAGNDGNGGSAGNDGNGGSAGNDGIGGSAGNSASGSAGTSGTEMCTGTTCNSSACVEGVLQDGCPLLLGDTPYQLSPAHALSSCLDDAAYSVAEGTAQVLWGCKSELQQTFWAVAQTDGYFAFRSALSGKCLQVHGASMAEGAVVEQSSCDGSAEQSWKPTRVDASLMQLTNKLSALVLGVAGTNVGTNGQLIVQEEPDGSLDTHWRLERRKAATHVAFSPYLDKSLRLQHAGALVTLVNDTSAATQWRVMPGLADPRQMSFQSRDEPSRYLRHASFRLWADINDGSEQFFKDATFQLAPPLVGADPLSKSLQPINYSNRRAQKSDDAVLFPASNDLDSKSATWWLRPG